MHRCEYCVFQRDVVVVYVGGGCLCVCVGVDGMWACTHGWVDVCVHPQVMMGCGHVCACGVVDKV